MTPQGRAAYRAGRSPDRDRKVCIAEAMQVRTERFEPAGAHSSPAANKDVQQDDKEVQTGLGPA
ncbi:MAG: hypothetical protein ACREP7_10650, partial [Lysobacter sp.]